MGGGRVEEGAVGLGRSVEMHRHVDVGCAADVVAWEDGGEVDGAVFVRLLGAAEHGVVEVGFVFCADAVSFVGDAAVDAG